MPVTCQFCGRAFPGDRVNSRHLSKCHPESSPKVLPCLCGHESTSLTQMKRHRKDCAIWNTRDGKTVRESRKRKTCLQKYGVETVTQAPSVREKCAQTNLERYGARSVFSRESSTFDRVQKSLDGKRPIMRGEDNPFSRSDVKQRIRVHWEALGVVGPTQLPEVRQRTRATNKARYGVEETLAAPEIRARIRATCEERYGGPAPSCSPEVLVKQQATNMERFGVPWTAMDPEVRKKQLETMELHWGAHYFASEEGKAAIRETMLERYGVEFPGAMVGHWDKAKAAFQARYGVAHPLRCSTFLAKLEKTMLQRHGYKHFIGTAQFTKSCLFRAGVPIPVDGIPSHPMKIHGYAIIHLQRMKRKGPNRLEQKVAKMAPELMFTGDGKFWRWLPSLGHFKNPDFIVPGSDPDHPRRSVHKVVETFGDFWHSRMRTGKSPFDHEQELINAFRDIGIDCLVLWESEVKADPEGTRERILMFVGQG